MGLTRRCTKLRATFSAAVPFARTASRRFLCWTVLTCLLLGGDHLLRISGQEDCSAAREVVVTEQASVSGVEDALAGAALCGVNSTTLSRVSVLWKGAVTTSRPLTVGAGVVLEISGYVDVANVDSSSSYAGDASSEFGAAVIDGSNETTLFKVAANGELHLSNVTLRAGRDGKTVGGGAVYAAGAGAIVSCENCRWESHSSTGSGGAMLAKAGATILLKGTNVFEGCSSTGGGGALFVEDSTCEIAEGGVAVFADCESLAEGGGIKLSDGSLVVSEGGSAEFQACHVGAKGGGVYTTKSTIEVADSGSLTFSGCNSDESRTADGANGGGLCAYDSAVTIGANSSLVFFNNSAPSSGGGGGMFGQSTIVTVAEGSTVRFANNTSVHGGGGIRLEWAQEDGYSGDDPSTDTCLVFDAGTRATFSDNVVGQFGGGAYFGQGCEVNVSGDISFEGNTAERAGALYGEGSSVRISGSASFVKNTASRWGGAVMMLDVPAGGLFLEGNVNFRSNHAGRSGGGVYLENAGIFVTNDDFVDALWEENSAGYDGGNIAVDGGNVTLHSGRYRNNIASQRGGVIFATGESLVEWTGGVSEGNTAAAGGALYMSNSRINVTNVVMAGDYAPSGAVVFLAAADVRATNVSFVKPVIPGEMVTGAFAAHVDAESLFLCFGCSFELWGDGNAAGAPCVLSEGTVVLDSCDFSGSNTSALVHSSPTAATVRNAILGSSNYAAADYEAGENFSVTVHTCSTLPEDYACLPVPVDEGGDSNAVGHSDLGADSVGCVNAESGMGVLCVSFLAEATGELVSIAGSSAVELVRDRTISTNDETVFFYPNPVSQLFVLRHSTGFADDSSSSRDRSGAEGGRGGTGGVLWEMRFDDGTADGAPANGAGLFGGYSEDGFSWSAVPASGLLADGRELNIKVLGIPPSSSDRTGSTDNVYNGPVRFAFFVVARTSDDTSRSEVVSFEGEFYYCNEGFYWSGEGCVSCSEEMASMANGGDVLDCSSPGFTLATLPLKQGYWRGNVSQTFIRPCLFPEACVGGTGMSPTAARSFDSSSSQVQSRAITTGDSGLILDNDTRYCKEGYRGVYCSLCADGYRQTSGHECVSCRGAGGYSAEALMWVLVLLTPVVLVIFVVFLLGGTSAVLELKGSVLRACSRKPSAASTHSRSTARMSGSTTDGFSESPNVGKQGDGGRRPQKWARGLMERLFQAIPFQKLKILIVVWQILTQFSALAEVPYPSSYRRFLRALDFFNFDIAWPLSVSCIIGELGFYARLIASTLGPLTVLTVLAFMFSVALYRHSAKSPEAAVARQHATVRHASAALLVCFLVFSSVSTTIFSTFSCDYVEDLGVSLLRADYRISCDHPDHFSFQVYAAFMILLYPVGIPLVFAYLLRQQKNKINPPYLHDATLPFPKQSRAGSGEKSARQKHDIATDLHGEKPDTQLLNKPDCQRVAGEPLKANGEGVGEEQEAARGRRRSPTHKQEGDTPVKDAEEKRERGHSQERSKRRSPDADGRGRRGCVVADTSGDRNVECSSSSDDNAWEREISEKEIEVVGVAEQEREKVLQGRLRDPDLQPTKFLWEPYEPSNYYYETVECGRRCLLTGALVFVMPNTAGQVAGACMFAFLSLLMFELLRPHLSQTDAWLYRIGCIVIFFSNFLGLMAKADISGEKAQSQELFGLVLILVHAIMILSIIAQGYISLQAASEARDEYVRDLLGDNKKINSSQAVLATPGGSSNGGKLRDTSNGAGKHDDAPRFTAESKEVGCDDDVPPASWEGARTSWEGELGDVEMGQEGNRHLRHRCSDSDESHSVFNETTATPLDGQRLGRAQNGSAHRSLAGGGTINSRAPTSVEMAPRRKRTTTVKNNRDFRATARDSAQRGSTASTEELPRYLRESSVGSVDLSSGANTQEEGYRSYYGLDRNTGNGSQNPGNGARNAKIRTENLETCPKNGAGGGGGRPKSSLVDTTGPHGFRGPGALVNGGTNVISGGAMGRESGRGGSRSTRTGKWTDDTFLSAAERELSRAIISRTSAGGHVSCSHAERLYASQGGPMGEFEAQVGGVRVAGSEVRAFIVNGNSGQPQIFEHYNRDGISLESKAGTSSTAKPTGPKKLLTPRGAKRGISKGGASAGDLKSAGKVEDSHGTLVDDCLPLQSNKRARAAKDGPESHTSTHNNVTTRRYERGDRPLRDTGRSVEVGVGRGDGERRRTGITEAAERFWSGDW